MPMIQPMIERWRSRGDDAPAVAAHAAGHLGWKPHAKARPLGELAMHIATGPAGACRHAAEQHGRHGIDSARRHTADGRRDRGRLRSGTGQAKSLLANLTMTILHSSWSMVHEGKRSSPCRNSPSSAPSFSSRLPTTAGSSARTAHARRDTLFSLRSTDRRRTTRILSHGLRAAAGHPIRRASIASCASSSTGWRRTCAGVKSTKCRKRGHQGDAVAVAA